MLPARVAGDVRRTVQAVRAVAPGRVTVALRATLAVALPLSAGVAAGRPELGAAASFGALAVLYVPQAPYRFRARVVRRVGLGLAAAVLLGSLAAGHGVVTVLVAGLVAGTASFVCQAAELPPPRELMLVMAVLAATDMPSDPAGAATRAGLAAAGALVAWLLTMAPALAGRWRAPEQAAVIAAIGAVAGLLDAVGSAGAGAARHAAVTGVQRARAAVSQAALPPGHPLAGLVVIAEALLEAALHVEVEATAPLDPGWAAAVRALTPAVHGLPVGNVVLPETVGTAGAGLLTRALTDARTASVPPAAARTLPPWPTLHRQLAAGLRRHSVVLPSAARIGIAVAVGVGLGQALGLGHAYWVGLTAAAVLQGSNLAVTRGRVLHRLAGTVAGVVLTFAVLGWNPPLWVVVLAVAAAQFAVELVIPVHYGLAVTAITVLALGLFHLGSPTEDVSSALGARLIDTAIGAALALVLRRVLWPRATVARLPQRQARVVAAVRAVFASAWSPELRPRLPERRRMLQTELAALRVVHADALADAGGADAAWPVSSAAEELAFLALSLPAHRPEPPPAAADAFLAHLDGLDAALSGSTRPPTGIPALPDHPRTAAAATALTAAVEVARG
ncbi:FUSC family protein [Pseudonocardia charpentierae]|uniref:FUSC family protein n=1 Tax=Pseudonocardia charpentierae TaxID=3075545 RepID=A0ABU2N5P2_9PSEU|nr:FUSC family protein [Pseudonocardia sp. DSM 45834]MDT0349250.1 FUSC family protein [Pseudonocardia sp. DSM 45834]